MDLKAAVRAGEAATSAELFELSPCGLVVCDDAGRIIRANASFCEMTGLDPAALKEANIGSLLTRASFFIYKARVAPQLALTGSVQEVSLDLKLADGQSLAVLLSARQAPAEGATVLTHIALFPARERRLFEQEQLKARRELRQYRDYLQMAEKLANVGHWSYALATGDIQWSPEVYVIYGQDPQMKAPPLNDVVALYHPDDRDMARQAMDSALADGGSFTYRARIVRGDDIGIVQVHGICERAPGGEVTGLFGICRDVTNFIRNQERLEQSEARYRLLADESNDIITIFDLSGCIEYISPAVKKILGYEPDDLVGRNVRDVIHRDDCDATFAAYSAYVRNKNWDEGLRVRYRAVHKDGHVIWAEAHPSPILDEAGERVVAFQDVVRDISHQKATEDALAQASIEANAAAEAKAQFLANMSHELRTPLTSIIGFSALLRDLLAGNDDLRRHSQRIHSAGQGLLNLINDILDHSKLEAGQLELDLAPASVADIAADVVDLLSLQAGNKGLTLTVEGADGLAPQALIDDGRLHQVLLNLVGNAVKFTETGGVTISLSQSRLPDGDRLRVSVRDTGPGISEAGKARLFERFSQVDRSAHDMPGGTGLGLSICKQLVELMSGTIGVNSAPGEGAEFWFEIPLPDMNLLHAAPVTVPHRPGRILVVDDQDAVTDLLVNLLTPYGHDIDVAINGYDGVQASQRAPYDLILMDINMPVMDGFAATRSIRSGCPFNADVPILGLTAAGGEARLQACLSAGMNAMLAKPVMPSALLNAVALWLNVPAGTAFDPTAAIRMASETKYKTA
ncbi:MULTISPECIES: PAS domain S-box protein [Asticcacaulis]|uniref:PAS domain S-box protein n=1 Tax=Asticcacaulis TaxID=76890 RepID=UPI001AE60FD6|nr:MULTISPECIES: PAS domain S-box protein [Asticcacaulis]MBP2159288.1 PAS domain S-box-containing protein [Asticcacaulis solisilvae]MDR6800333.1 PAS domain S-box-containing protein [Asticcacaulis sp. BE141]